MADLVQWYTKQNCVFPLLLHKLPETKSWFFTPFWWEDSINKALNGLIMFIPITSLMHQFPQFPKAYGFILELLVRTPPPKKMIFPIYFPNSKFPFGKYGQWGPLSMAKLTSITWLTSGLIGGKFYILLEYKQLCYSDCFFVLWEYGCYWLLLYIQLCCYWCTNEAMIDSTNPKICWDDDIPKIFRKSYSSHVPVTTNQIYDITDIYIYVV